MGIRRITPTVAALLAGAGLLSAQNPTEPADPQQQAAGRHGHRMSATMMGAQSEPGALTVLASGAVAAGQAASPYASLEPRRVQALSRERESGLLAGAGLGYAMAAELNGHAGPKHVLELAEALELTPEQRAGVEASFAQMKAAAVALGAEIVAAEEELDRRFSHRHLDEATLAGLTARIAELEGRLRFVHLRAHLETDALLSARQRDRYSELRGYVGHGSGDPTHEGHAEHPSG